MKNYPPLDNLINPPFTKILLLLFQAEKGSQKSFFDLFVAKVSFRFSIKNIYFSLQFRDIAISRESGRSWQRSRNWNTEIMETRIRISIQKIKKKKKTNRLHPPPLFCSFARPMQIRRENRGRGREDRSTCHRMSTHDRSRVGRGINMKSCRLIYDPGTGRPLLDLWRYPLSLPPPLSLRKTSALFSICSRRGRIVGQLSFFQNVLTRFCVTVSRDLYS